MRDFYDILIVRELYFWVGEGHYLYIAEVRDIQRNADNVFVTRIEGEPVRPQDLKPGGQRFLGHTLKEAKLVLVNRLREQTLLPEATKRKVERLYRELTGEEQPGRAVSED